MNTATLQRHLRRLGFDPGACDGVTGPRTRAAISAFCSARGLEPVESPNQDFWGELLDASTRVVDGIDTSYFQTTQDWSKLSRPLEVGDVIVPRGFEFVLPRASVGTSNDSTFVEKAAAANGAGVPVVPYHFFYVLSTPPGPQIDVLAEQCRRAGVRSATVALDVESTPGKIANESDADFGRRLSAWFASNGEKILDNLRAAVALCVATFGKKPILYTYPFYWRDLGAAALSPEWPACPLWLSAPTKAGGIHAPIAPWPSTALHQWTDDRNVVLPVDGYGGPHVLADRFAGTLEEFRSLL